MVDVPTFGSVVIPVHARLELTLEIGFQLFDRVAYDVFPVLAGFVAVERVTDASTHRPVQMVRRVFCLSLLSISVDTFLMPVVIAFLLCLFLLGISGSSSIPVSFSFTRRFFS
jgi:hypothetical protein